MAKKIERKATIIGEVAKGIDDIYIKTYGAGYYAQVPKGYGYKEGEKVKVTIEPVKQDKESDFSEGPSTPYDLSPLESGP